MRPTNSIATSLLAKKPAILCRLIFTLLFFSFSGKCAALEAILAKDADASAAIEHLLNSNSTISEKDINVSLKTQAGSIIFWINPSFNTSNSHTFFSSSWTPSNPAPSYMTISDGWWEESVPKALYFVIDNSQTAFCYVQNFTFQNNYWYQIALTWGKEKNKNYCRIYINGEIKSESIIPPLTEKTTSQTIFFSDKLTDSPRNRTTQGSTSDWIFFTQTLKHDDIVKIFRKTLTSHQPIAPSQIDSIIGMSTEKASPSEIRALFDEDIYWALSKENTDRVLNLAQAGGFNVLIPCVWHGNGAYFGSSTHIYADAIRTRIANNDDPLTYLTAEAHKRGIAIYPWFTVVKNESTNLKQYATTNVEGAFDIHNEAFQNFISGLVIDVIQRYDIDGINLDYIRSMGICTNQHCQDDFAQKYNGNLLLEAPLSRVLKHTNSDIFNNHVAQWNANALLSILKKISSEARRTKPQLKISVDSVPLSPDFLLQGHNSIEWANADLIDTIFSMDYASDPNVQEINAAKKELTSPEKLIPLFSVYDLVGGKVIPRSSTQISQYIRLTRTLWPNSGFAFYHRKQITKEHLDALTMSTHEKPNSQPETILK